MTYCWFLTVKQLYLSSCYFFSTMWWNIVSCCVDGSEILSFILQLDVITSMWIVNVTLSICTTCLHVEFVCSKCVKYKWPAVYLGPLSQSNKFNVVLSLNYWQAMFFMFLLYTFDIEVWNVLLLSCPSRMAWCWKLQKLVQSSTVPSVNRYYQMAGAAMFAEVCLPSYLEWSLPCLLHSDNIFPLPT